MEHNFTFNSTGEMYLVRNLLDAIFRNTSEYQAMRSIITFGHELPDINVYEINWGELIDRLNSAIDKADEEEKPKYEHRWEVRQGSEYVAEFDSLEDAFEYYIDCYKNDWAESAFNEGEYNIYDNELQIELTDKTPAFTVEYNWDANINVECEGTSIYTDDTPDEVMESIRDAFYNGDDYGTYTYDYDGIYFNSVQSALERAKEERRNANA